MLPIQTTFLFKDPPRLDLVTVGEDLVARLNSIGRDAEEISPAQGDLLRFRVGELSIGIAISPTRVPLRDFANATQSPLSRCSQDQLRHCVDVHQHQLSINLDQADTASTSNPIQQLRLAHSVASFFAEQTPPLAVHWRQSDILMTGSQYLGLAKQKTPWALFARLAVTEPASANSDLGTKISIENAVDFIGAPVQLDVANMALDTACAGAIAFLRHAIQSDVPLGDGQTFGAGPGMLFRLKLSKPCTDSPVGLYQLSVATGQTETVPGVAARIPGTTFKETPMTNDQPEKGAAALPGLNPVEQDTEKTRSLALSYLMLVIMPPLGAILLVTNLILGVNATRTGLLALVAVATGLVIGAYSFLNVGAQDSAILSQPAEIINQPLDN